MPYFLYIAQSRVYAIFVGLSERQVGIATPCIGHAVYPIIHWLKVVSNQAMYIIPLLFAVTLKEPRSWIHPPVAFLDFQQGLSDKSKNWKEKKS